MTRIDLPVRQLVSVNVPLAGGLPEIGATDDVALGADEECRLEDALVGLRDLWRRG